MKLSSSRFQTQVAFEFIELIKIVTLQEYNTGI